MRRRRAKPDHGAMVEPIARSVRRWVDSVSVNLCVRGGVREPPATGLGQRVVPGLPGSAHGPEEVPGPGARQDHFEEASGPAAAIRSVPQENGVRDMTVMDGDELEQSTKEGVQGGWHRWPVRTGDDGVGIGHTVNWPLVRAPIRGDKDPGSRSASFELIRQSNIAPTQARSMAANRSRTEVL